MRIPPSVFVMSLLCAVPFGLGIRDTLTARDASADDEYDVGLDLGSERSSRARRADLAQYEAEMRREAEEREAVNAARLARLAQIYGTTPASMGSLLDGIVVGANAGTFQPEHVRERIEMATRDNFISVSFKADASTLNLVKVHLDGDDDTACEKLENDLDAAWGRSTNGRWIDPATRQRATLTGCSLWFDRYLEPTEWVAQLPIQHIGSSVDKLTTALGGAVDDSRSDFVAWHMNGLPSGETGTELEAYATRNRVESIAVISDSDFDTTLAVRDALSARLKTRPKKDEDTNAWTWTGRVPATLEVIETDRFKLTVGKI